MLYTGTHQALRYKCGGQKKLFPFSAKTAAISHT